MAKHAYLAASASHRWLKCPPSARLCARRIPPVASLASQEIMAFPADTPTTMPLASTVAMVSSELDQVRANPRR